MSIELLDKTRRINRLLSEHHSSKMAFDDICGVLGQLLSACVYVISNKGKVLGTYISEVNSFPVVIGSKGDHIDFKLNERLMNVLSTKENVSLETFGFTGDEIADFKVLIDPICISGQHLGTLLLGRQRENFNIEDIILSEYGTAVVGIEMMWSVQEESDIERQKRQTVSSAITTLTSLEQRAVACVIHELDGREGTVVTSKLATRIGITRTVIVNALRKLESAGLLKTKSSGVKGTHIRIMNDLVCREFDEYYRGKGSSWTQKDL